MTVPSLRTFARRRQQASALALELRRDPQINDRVFNRFFKSLDSKSPPSPRYPEVVTPYLSRALHVLLPSNRRATA